MIIINQSHRIISKPEDPLQLIEDVARTCYKSEDFKKEGSAEKMVRMLVNRGHHAMIEFGDIIVHFTTNRGVTHELVRHRLCSFAQESTRYVNYNKKGMEFIRPVWLPDLKTGEYKFKHSCFPNQTHATTLFLESLVEAEENYNNLINQGWRPEQAREVLPNALKTEINVKGNLREWRHIFSLRCSQAAHPQIRALMVPVLDELSKSIPVIFDDLVEKFIVGGVEA